MRQPTLKLRPMWVAFLIGGNYRQPCGGCAWYPGVVWRTWNYWRQGWRHHGRSWWQFVDPRIKYSSPRIDG